MNPEILFEAKLKRVGRTMLLGAFWITVLWIGGGLVATFVLHLFPKTHSALEFFGFGLICPGLYVSLGIYLCSRPGVYRIQIDDYGIYVESDAHTIAPSFTVIAPDLKCLIRKTIKGDSDMIRYYVETKSGKRYPIEESLLIDGAREVEVMEIFDKITDRFTWVEIVEEVEW